jgi:cupin fold WbuC family metalloprotein
MLIVSHRDTYVAPHRHAHKSETFIVLEGLVTALLFSVDGSLQQTIKMGPASSGRAFFYRMPQLQFHSLSIESELIVFIESTKGPFRVEDVENAPWAPGPSATAAGREYIASILAKAQVA